MFSLNIRKLLIGSIFAVAMTTSALANSDHVTPLQEFAKSTISKWITNQEIIEAILAQNTEHANLTEAQIIELDKKWRAETELSVRPMIENILANEVSSIVTKFEKNTMGLVSEIIVLDNKGLNVGQSTVTSDYWQGDESKWQKTYLVGPEEIFVDEIEVDESSQILQSQVSMTIKDPATGKAIGAITVGINLEEL